MGPLGRCGPGRGRQRGPVAQLGLLGGGGEFPWGTGGDQAGPGGVTGGAGRHGGGGRGEGLSPGLQGASQPGGEELLPGVGVPVGLGLKVGLEGPELVLIGLGGLGFRVWVRKLGLGRILGLSPGQGQGPGLGQGPALELELELGRRAPFPFGLGPFWETPLAPASAGGKGFPGRNRAKAPPHGSKNRLEGGVDRRSSFCLLP